MNGLDPKGNRGALGHETFKGRAGMIKKARDNPHEAPAFALHRHQALERLPPSFRVPLLIWLCWSEEAAPVRRPLPVASRPRVTAASDNPDGDLVQRHLAFVPPRTV
eukprot:Polyplicarium_translucidae@DN3764_c0_g1_i1.p1